MNQLPPMTQGVIVDTVPRKWTLPTVLFEGSDSLPTRLPNKTESVLALLFI